MSINSTLGKFCKDENCLMKNPGQFFDIHYEDTLNSCHICESTHDIFYGMEILKQNRNDSVYYYIWAWHRKCIEMSTNKPSLDPEVLGMAFVQNCLKNAVKVNGL